MANWQFSFTLFYALTREILTRFSFIHLAPACREWYPSLDGTSPVNYEEYIFPVVIMPSAKDPAFHKQL